MAEDQAVPTYLGVQIEVLHWGSLCECTACSQCRQPHTTLRVKDSMCSTACDVELSGLVHGGHLNRAMLACPHHKAAFYISTGWILRMECICCIVCMHVAARLMILVAAGNLGAIWQPYVWDFAKLLGWVYPGKSHFHNLKSSLKVKMWLPWWRLLPSLQMLYSWTHYACVACQVSADKTLLCSCLLWMWRKTF